MGELTEKIVVVSVRIQIVLLFYVQLNVILMKRLTGQCDNPRHKHRSLRLILGFSLHSNNCKFTVIHDGVINNIAEEPQYVLAIPPKAM